MTPGRRRRAVGTLQERFGVSERRACRVAGQHRSTQRKQPRPPCDADQRLARRLREIAKEHPRWGWKTAHEILLREGWTLNRKRTRRIWRQEGLRRPVRARKRRRASNGQATRLRATKPNEVWAVDFQFDETSDRRRIKLCNVVDEYTREALAIRVDRTCTAENVITIIEQLAEVVIEQVDVHRERERRGVVAAPPLHLDRIPPCANRREAQVWRSVWNATHGTPASSAAGFNTRRCRLP